MRSILLLLCISFTLFAKDIHVSTYNVENLFDGYDNGHEYRDFRVKSRKWSKKLANTKLNHTIKAIKSIDADIIALQEIENRSILKILAKKTNFKYFAFSKPSGSPVGVAVVSNYPILSKKSIYAGIKKTRDFLHVVVDIGGEKLGLWVVHFPTQKYPHHKRLKVAKTLKKAIYSSKEKDFLILGDFNTKISPKSILQKTFGTLIDKKNLYDPWNEIGYKNRYSQSFFGKKSALDRIIISEGLLDNRGLEYKNNSFTVIKNSLLSDKKSNPIRWKNRNRLGYSDHFPIMLTISTTPNQLITPKAISINEIYNLKDGRVNIKLDKAVVIYKNRHGAILSQKGRGVYVYGANLSLKYSYMYDLGVTNIAKYKGSKEITSLHVIKDYGKISSTNGYYLSAKNIKHAKPNDVIKNISGEYKNGYLYTKYGKIKLYSKEKLKKYLNLKMVRVGRYNGELELIMEK